MADIAIGSNWDRAPSNWTGAWLRIARRLEAMRRLHRTKRRARVLRRALREADQHMRDDLGVRSCRRGDWMAFMVQR
jgi:hypothetical protein